MRDSIVLNYSIKVLELGRQYKKKIKGLKKIERKKLHMRQLFIKSWLKIFVFKSKV